MKIWITIALALALAACGIFGDDQKFKSVVKMYDQADTPEERAFVACVGVMGIA